MRRFVLPFVFALAIPIVIGLLDIGCFRAVCNNFVSCTECVANETDNRIAAFMCLRKYGCIDVNKHWLIRYSDKEFQRCNQYDPDRYNRLCENQRLRLDSETVLRV